ncbi:UNVERIFIED_CONTAM: hypothetical protein FKN15_048320 [Acipenser sinensis]
MDSVSPELSGRPVSERGHRGFGLLLKGKIPQWLLNVVLRALPKLPIESLHSTELKYLSLKTAFLLAITFTRCVTASTLYLLMHKAYIQYSSSLEEGENLVSLEDWCTEELKQVPSSSFGPLSCSWSLSTTPELKCCLCLIPEYISANITFPE